MDRSRYSILLFVASVIHFASSEKFVSISNETRLASKTSLKLMHYAFDKKPMERIALGCRNRVSSMLLGDYPFAEVRWKHNSNNLVLKSSRMTLFGADMLNIQQLNPTDSGVYTCEISPNSQNKIIVAFHSLVVGENWFHVVIEDTFNLSSNSQEIGKLFKASRRTWYRNGKKVIDNPAIAWDIEFKDASEENSIGVWVCEVTDKETGRKWVTARHKVILDMQPSFWTRIRIFVKNRRTEAIAILTGITFGIAAIVNGITKLLEMRRQRHDREMEYLKKELGIPEPWEELERMAEEIPLVDSDSRQPLLNKNNAARILNIRGSDTECGASDSEYELFVRTFK